MQQEIYTEVGRLEERMNALEYRLSRHEKKQNGSLEKIDGKLDKLNTWLIGLLGGMVVTLTLTVLNMAAGR